MSCTTGRKNKNMKIADSADSVILENGDPGDDSEEFNVVEEGDPVKPGDTLVVALPFVYAIQPQFKTKVCEYCLK